LAILKEVDISAYLYLRKGSLGRGPGNLLLVGFFAGLMGMALGLLGDPVAGVSERVHFEV
jgi:hypothetical protein